MKRLIIAFLLGTVLLTSESFTEGPKLNSAVLKSFNSAFRNATTVTWQMVGDYYRASFTEDNKALYAYFNDDGEWVATSRFIPAGDLPATLKKELRKYNSTIIEVFEVDSKEGTRYYATLDDGKNNTILESVTSSWIVFKKDKKS
jgi:ketosteroid isomerase-like protein